MDRPQLDQRYALGDVDAELALNSDGYRSFGIAVDNARVAAAHPGSAREGTRHFFLATLRDRERFVMPLHGGPPVFTPATRERQAGVRTILRGLIERGQADGELRADLSPEDLDVTSSVLSRPLPGLAPSLLSRRGSEAGAWDRVARRQIDLLVDGLGAGAGQGWGAGRRRHGALTPGPGRGLSRTAAASTTGARRKRG
jgi:hypothetical protein